MTPALRLFSVVTLLSVLAGCASRQDNTWSDIDYSKVYKAAGERRDMDSGYKAPSVIGCVDDDLYNCR